VGGLVGEHVLATMGGGRCGVRAPLGAWRRTSGRRKGLASRQHRTGGRRKGLVVSCQQKGATTQVGRTLRLLEQEEMGKTCLAGITALACNQGGRAGVIAQFSSATDSTGGRGRVQPLRWRRLQQATAASSLFVWLQLVWWCAWLGVGVTCWPGEQQKGVALRAERVASLLLQGEMEARKVTPASASDHGRRSVRKTGASHLVQIITTIFDLRLTRLLIAAEGVHNSCESLARRKFIAVSSLFMQQRDWWRAQPRQSVTCERPVEVASSGVAC
jgi:hypothetical protein